MTVSPLDETTLETAVAIARLAGDSTLPWFQNGDLVVDRKSDGTPVTEADRHAEKVTRAALAKHFPDDGIIGEEEGTTPGVSGRRWYIDPIDGTKAFTRGVPLYSTLLALEDAEGIALGVIHLPALGETVWAGRGRGAWWNGAPAAVSTRDQLAGSMLTTSGYDYWPDEMLAGARQAKMQMRTWGDGYGYALVATGRADAMVDPIAEPYDIAPMPVIITEAGGRFSDLYGTETHTGGNGVATNGLLHTELLGYLNP